MDRLRYLVKLCIFTLAFNAMPMITWHLPVFSQMQSDWHWFIAHGGASNDRGFVQYEQTERGLSTDGTTEYLLALRGHPRITVIERPEWNGLTDCTNTCLERIGVPCVLLYLDSDEYWRADQIDNVVKMFRHDDNIGKADFFYRHFLGPNLVVGGVNGWGTALGVRRAWRYRPGQRFGCYEVPDLDVSPLRLATAPETRQYGLVFDHWSYAFESQLASKERRLGYRKALSCWRALHHNETWPVTDLQKWLPWVGPNVSADQLYSHPHNKPIMSETDKHRPLVVQYCKGNGVDLGSSGEPVVPWAIQVDLPASEYHNYNVERPEANIHWRGNALELPFKDGTLDWVHSSHLIEDFLDWKPVLAEWDRVLKPGGFMIIAVPDHQRFRAAVARGQGDNLSHRHESHVGELPKVLGKKYETVRDGFVNDDPNEYSILYVGRKTT